MADDQVQDTTNDQVLDTPPPKPQDGPGGDDGNGKDKLTAEEALALVEKANKDRSSANKEAIAAKKRAEAAEKKLKEIEDSKKDEYQKAQEKAEAEAKRAEAAEARALHLERIGDARDAGVSSKYRDYAVSEFAKTVKEKPETDPVEFYKTFKEDHPAMFNGKPPVHPTAKGGANAPVATDEVTRAIAEVEEKIKRAKGIERVALTKRLKQLQTQKGAAK